MAFPKRLLLFPEDWAWKGRCFPQVEPCAAKGRACGKAIQRGHAYCQVEKVGRICNWSSFRVTEHFAGQAAWLVPWWQMRKLTTRAFKREVLRFRALNAQKLFEAIEFIASTEAEQKDRDLQKELQVKIASGLKPFLHFPEIATWKASYDTEHIGKVPRFKFLVLSGDSRHGKTQLAKSLFGVDHTLVLDCQQVEEPNLRRFDRRVHKAIVFDEISPLCVAKNKVMFQASIEGVDCGQTKTSIYAYWRFLYGVPLIVCTNEWIDALPDEQRGEHGKAIDWLVKNQVHVAIAADAWHR